MAQVALNVIDDIIRMIFCLPSHASNIFHYSKRYLAFMFEIKEFIKNEDLKRDGNEILSIPMPGDSSFFARRCPVRSIGFPISISVSDRRDYIARIDK